MTCWSSRIVLPPIAEGSVESGKPTVAPMIFKPGIILETPRIMTSTAEKVIKCRWIFFFAKLEKAPMPANDGNVPKEKASIVNAPTKKLPFPKTYSCSAWVKPQGRKNVEAPKKKETFGLAACCWVLAS